MPHHGISLALYTFVFGPIHYRRNRPRKLLPVGSVFALPSAAAVDAICARSERHFCWGIKSVAKLCLHLIYIERLE
jgi:hypothetical protein